MASDLEEPGWPASLTPKASPGEIFANAFARAAAINVQKQHLQQQLAEMQANMMYKNQAHELDMQQFGWKQKMDLANLNRQYAAEASDNAYRDAMLGLRSKEVNNKVTKGLDLIDRGARFSDKVAALNETETPGTIKYGTGYKAIQTEFQDFLQTQQGGRLNKDYLDWHKAGALQMGKDAQQAHQRFYDNLAAIGKSKEFNVDDFTIGKWGTNQDGSKYIVVDPKTGARIDPATIGKRTLPPEAYHTMPKDFYDLQMNAVKDINKYRSGDPSQMPDIVQPPSDRESQARMIMNDPDASAQARAVAQKVLNGE